MTSKKMLLLLSLLGLMLGTQSALAASAAVREMASILVHLEHYPSAEDKVKLNGIAENKSSTKQEQVLATSISNLKHQVADGDKDNLKHVMDDAAAPIEVRELASITLNIRHFPSAADKAKLEQMMK